MQLTTYQDAAVRDLLEKAKKLLGQGGNKRIVLKAPTGSGKTIMVAEFLTRFADDKTHGPCSFIWTAPRQLHEQSKEKLELYFSESRAIECASFEDLDDRQIDENEVLFFNWESIRQNSNIYIRENEQDNNLSSVLARTRETGREIVLIIDESHYHVQADTSQNLIAAIAPKLMIEVSATPILKGDEMVRVDIGDIKREGISGRAMIKKSLILNEGFKNLLEKNGLIQSELAAKSDDVVLDVALKKRRALADAYKNTSVAINPLLLIQLPDRHRQADDDRQSAIVQELKDSHGISVENGKLAIYLSADKQNLERVTRGDSGVDVLIFKQAIALGWDCPRAQVLVLFREWSSPEFSIQTVGRIMRMPEPMRGYYDNELLNHSYVYTNLSDIDVKEDVGRDYVTIHTSKRSSEYSPIDLSSVHRKRHREQTRLTPLFTRLFFVASINYDLKGKIQVKGQKVQQSFIAEWHTEDVDMVAGTHLKGDVYAGEISDIDAQRLFDYFVRKNLSPFYPEDRSVGRVKETLYQFFVLEYGMDRIKDFRIIIDAILSDNNREYFVAVIDATKIAYKEDTERREHELEGDVWNVPVQEVFGSGYAETHLAKAIMQPFYSDERWQTESAFVALLEQQNNGVRWWFKNGARDATYFAVPYADGAGEAPFYVDFIVMMKDGSIGLFDPHGIHLADFAAKSDGLRGYIADQNKKGTKLFGGIVANTDSRNYTGRWMMYVGDGRDAGKDGWSRWVELLL